MPWVRRMAAPVGMRETNSPRLKPPRSLWGPISLLHSIAEARPLSPDAISTFGARMTSASIFEPLRWMVLAALTTLILRLPALKLTSFASMLCMFTWPVTETMPSGAEIFFRLRASGQQSFTSPFAEVSVCSGCAGTPSMTMSPSCSIERAPSSMCNATPAGRTSAPFVAAPFVAIWRSPILLNKRLFCRDSRNTRNHCHQPGGLPSTREPRSLC